MTVPNRVLIVDDEEDITWGLSKSLGKTHPSVEVECVYSGEQALNRLSAKPFNLVVSDVRMPNGDGRNLILEIRRTYPQTKVIVMTAYGSAELKNELEERGCFFYIEKPFDTGYLKQIILGALEIENNGFKGMIDQVGIRELVEFNCLRKRDASLLVTRNREQGKIYFSNGDIIHAECGELKGERAFYSILNWDSGTFKIVTNRKKTKRTIRRDWKALLHQYI